MSEIPSSPPEATQSVESQKPDPQSPEKSEIFSSPPEKRVGTERDKWESDIKQALEKHHLFYDQDLWDRRINDGRYLRLNVVEFDNDETDNRQILKERFFKAPIHTEDQESTEKNKAFFIRQVKVQEYLSERTNFPVTEILDSNLDVDSGPLYSVVNWYQKGEGIGFIYGPEGTDALAAEHAPPTIKAIHDLHHQERFLTPEVREILDKRVAYENFDGFRSNLNEILDRQVSGVGEDFSTEKRSFAQVIAKRTNTPDLVQRIDQLLEEARPIIERHQGQGEHIVHGDYAPNNIFLGDGLASDKFIGLDFEWAGYSQNEVLASIYDFGNMRERAWSNPEFQAALDREMIASYATKGQEEEGRVIVALGTLRSSLNLSSYFENLEENYEYPEQIEQRVGTERDILTAFQMLKTPETPPSTNG